MGLQGFPPPLPQAAEMGGSISHWKSSIFSLSPPQYLPLPPPLPRAPRSLPLFLPLLPFLLLDNIFSPSSGQEGAVGGSRCSSPPPIHSPRAVLWGSVPPPWSHNVPIFAHSGAAQSQGGAELWGLRGPPLPTLRPPPPFDFQTRVWMRIKATTVYVGGGPITILPLYWGSPHITVLSQSPISHPITPPPQINSPPRPNIGMQPSCEPNPFGSVCHKWSPMGR